MTTTIKHVPADDQRVPVGGLQAGSVFELEGDLHLRVASARNHKEAQTISLTGERSGYLAWIAKNVLVRPFASAEIHTTQRNGGSSGD